MPLLETALVSDAVYKEMCHYGLVLPGQPRPSVHYNVVMDIYVRGSMRMNCQLEHSL